MENRSVKSTQAEQLEQWVKNAVVSLSASLVLVEIRRANFSAFANALFTLTSNDYKKALGSLLASMIFPLSEFS